MAFYRVNFLLRYGDGTRATSPIIVESTSFQGGMRNAMGKWEGPGFYAEEGEIYGINIREIRPRGKQATARVGHAPSNGGTQD